jgi:hypothetical protein
MFRWPINFARGWLSTIALVALLSPAVAADLPLLVKEDFEAGAARWQPTDAKAWKVVSTPQGKVYSLFQQSDYKPPHRSPLNFSLLKTVVVGDFVLEAKVQSTVKDYDHRDMVMVFGYQDPAHYYYVHFGKKTDDHANQIFIVNDAPRLKISTKTTPGTPLDDAWHHVKIVRVVADGQIEVYFDDFKSPAMTASDKTFAWGQVGVGSFDDTGNYDDVVLRGVAVTHDKPLK